MTSWDWVEVLILGGGVGLISSVLGLGGGILIVPLLPLITPLSQQETLATSLFSIFFVVIMNTWRFHRRGLIEWHLAWAFGPATALGAFVAGRWSLFLSETILRLLLGTVMILFALQTGRSAWLSRRPVPPTVEPQVRRWKLMAVGYLNGILAGLTGIGSGIVLNPLMMQWRLTKDIKVSPTANAIMVYSTGAGAMAFAWGLKGWDLNGSRLGFIHLDVAAVLTLMAWIISPWGRRWQELLSPGQRRWIFTIILLGLGLHVLIKIPGY